MGDQHGGRGGVGRAGAARGGGGVFHPPAFPGPALADIHEVHQSEAAPEPGESEFIIQASQAGKRSTLISPDVAVCEACLAEMNDPSDRRHGYAFINCTHCGPRYTIIEDLPYDRPQTTMRAFTLCPACLAEYENPTDRRFHAQPNACPVCGPSLWLADAAGRKLDEPDPITAAAKALADGKVLAIKGLGGFHLAVDAKNPAAVALLRSRKLREEKPLAVMTPDLTTARSLAELDEASAQALSSRERPIVLAPLRLDAGLAPGVAPGNRLLGLMLPYTPLHHLLLAEARCRGMDALVMTSGNISDEPICLDNEEAVRRLGNSAQRGALADLMLLHNRDIYLRSDDSVVRGGGRETAPDAALAGLRAFAAHPAARAGTSGLPADPGRGRAAEEHPVPAQGPGGLCQPARGRLGRSAHPGVFSSSLPGI